MKTTKTKKPAPTPPPQLDPAAAAPPPPPPIDEPKIYLEERRSIVMLQLSQLTESKLNPRKRGLTQKEVEDLANSIKSVGVLQPLTVRKVFDKNVESFEVVFGHRRFRAAKLIDLALVPCEIREMTDAQVLEVQLVENVNREDLTWLEEGDGYNKLADLGNFDVDEVARRVGKTRGWVYGRMKLKNLGPEARKTFNDGRLPGSVALAMARVPHALQAKALEQVAPTKWDPPTARRAIEMIQQEFCRQLRHAPFSLTDDMLVTKAGACAKCPKNSRNAPELFSDFDRESAGGAKGVCSDVVCYDEKLAAHTAVQTSSLVAAGAKPVPEKDAPRFFGHEDQLQYGQGWVKVDEPMGNDNKRRTWRQLLAKMPDEQRPQVYVAAAPSGNVVQLFKRDAAMEAAAELGHAFAKTEVKEEQKEQKERKKHAKARDAKKERLQIVAEVGERIAAQVEARGPTVREWRIIARAYLELRLLDRVLERRGLTRAQYEKLVEEKGDAGEIAGLIMEVAADQFGANCHQDFPEDFTAMATAYQIDPERLLTLAEQRKDEKKAAREEKKKGAA